MEFVVCCTTLLFYSQNHIAGYELRVLLVEGRFTDPNMKIPDIIYWWNHTYDQPKITVVVPHLRQRWIDGRHRVLPASFQCYRLWVAFLILDVSLSLMIGIPDMFSTCGTLLRKLPAGPECISSVCSRLSWLFGGTCMIKYMKKQLQSTEYIVSTSFRNIYGTHLSSTRWPMLYAAYLVVFFSLDLGVQRTHRQSARCQTPHVNGNDLLPLLDTSIGARQGVRLLSVWAGLQITEMTMRTPLSWTRNHLLYKVRDLAQQKR